MEIDTACKHQTMREYINQYQGQIRFVKLLTIVEKNPTLREEALRLCHELVASEKKLR